MRENLDPLNEDDDEFDADELDVDDDADVTTCPECGVDIYDDLPICPRCGIAITTDTSPWAGRPIWWIVLGLLGILATIYLLVR